ncbi:MAG: tRNA (guanosine(46)-N7)-methyltransferase TrmB [Proteobacteria bacterium]|nr:tRNA (guanosine(46)-N7)-methyltransferase TrmB [Pseudomonadota bacterium]
MSRRLKTDIHGPDWRRGIDDLRERGIPAAFAPELEPPLHLVVEIGFGRGEFLKDLAQRSPETAFLAIDASHKRVLKMARRLALGELRNIRLVAARAEIVVEDMLLPESVACFWINFPDPWPKKRHHRRRLIQPQLIARLATRLVPGGVVWAATDHVEYAQQIHEVLSKEDALENDYAPAPWRREVPGRMVTAYELEWRAEGRTLHFFAYRRRPSASRSQ